MGTHAKAQQMDRPGRASTWKNAGRKNGAEGIGRVSRAGATHASRIGGAPIAGARRMNPVMTANVHARGKAGATAVSDVNGLYLAGARRIRGSGGVLRDSGVLAAVGMRRICLIAATSLERRRAQAAGGADWERTARDSVAWLSDHLQVWSSLRRDSTANCEVIAFDWPGMGYSEAWSGGHSFLICATADHVDG